MDFPSDDLPAPDIDDHIAVIVDAADRAFQIRDVPTEYLMRSGSCQFRRSRPPNAFPAVRSVMQQSLAFQYAIETAHRSDVGSFV